MTRYLSLALILIASTVAAAHADTIQVSYLGAGVQASTVANTYTETFNGTTAGKNLLYTTTFGNSGITGVYTGSFGFAGADAFGGAGGTGNYITTGGYSGFGSSYTLSLSKGVNYFGLWFSALDSANDLKFYNGTTLLLDYTPTQFASYAGSCTASAYCGNPNNGQDKGEQFAFINFYDTIGTFNSITFTENSATAGFESDNHTVGNITSAPGGTQIAITPEPSSLALLGTGVLGVATLLRRRSVSNR